MTRILPLVLGLLVALGQAPWDLWWLALGGLAGLAALVIRAQSAWQAAKAAWFVGIAHFGLSLHWIVQPFLVDAARHGWMAPFALIFCAAGFALFFGMPAWAAARLTAPGAARGAAFAAALALSEMLRAYLFTGFPWASPVHLWISTAGITAFGWLGPYGLTALTMLLVVPAGLAAVRLTAPATALLSLPLLALPLLPRADVAEDGPLVRLVQPNAPQHLKWDPEHSGTFLRRAVDATRAPGAPDLIVWPETSIPYLMSEAGPVLDAVDEAAGDAPVVVGLLRREGARAYNSLLMMGPEGQTLYDKHHLVPFGEFMPLGDLLGRVGIRGLAARDGGGFTAGPGPRLIKLPGIGPALPLICYEAIFPHGMRAEGRPRFLMQITNDAWFGTFAGPQQHLAQARARAAEQGLPLVRAANTGISAVIDPAGRILAQLPLGEAGHIDAALPAALPPTPYARTGDLPWLVLLLLGLAAARAASARIDRARRSA